MPRWAWELIRYRATAFERLSNPKQLREGGVLLVGGGNSGAELAVEIVRHHRTWMSGRDTGHIPFRIDGLPARLFLRAFCASLRVPSGTDGQDADGPKGTAASPFPRRAADSRPKPADLKAAGVERVPKWPASRDGTAGARRRGVLDVTNVIWCTGFSSGLHLDSFARLRG